MTQHFTFTAEASDGSTVAEARLPAATRAEACAAFWRGLTDDQRDATACLECLDGVTP